MLAPTRPSRPAIRPRLLNIDSGESQREAGSLHILREFIGLIVLHCHEKPCVFVSHDASLAGRGELQGPAIGVSRGGDIVIVFKLPVASAAEPVVWTEFCDLGLPRAGDYSIVFRPHE